ncbi:MAG: phospholipase D-like domain-containing protein [Patescibacteria group bacterium]|jgi:phosphatidylserine/phosphatidylglycerophosphate/cardiolipin synthase-like enzyme
MFNQKQAFREYLNRRQDAIDSEKSQDSQTSKLFNDKNFYSAFTKDMLNAKKEVIIYSPFVAKFRMDELKQTVEKLRKRNIEIFIFTRPTDEYETIFQPQIQCALKRYGELGVSIFYLGGSIHEKVAIIDREILWEGSLNILSQRASKEMMRRTSSKDSAMQIMFYLGLNKKLAESYKLKYERLYRSLIDNSGQNFRQKMYIFLFGFTIALVFWWTLVNFREIKLFSPWNWLVMSFI